MTVIVAVEYRGNWILQVVFGDIGEKDMKEGLVGYFFKYQELYHPSSTPPQVQICQLSKTEGGQELLDGVRAGGETSGKRTEWLIGGRTGDNSGQWKTNPVSPMSHYVGATFVAVAANVRSHLGGRPRLPACTSRDFVSPCESSSQP